MIEMGFIGVGNMGAALAQAAAKKLPGGSLLLANRTAEKAQALAALLGCGIGDNDAVAARCRFILLGVKPQMMASVLAGIAPVLRARTEPFVLVTMAAGLTTARIREMAGGDYPVIRIMPNTPCRIGRGVVLCCRSAQVTDADYGSFRSYLSAAGTLVDLAEGQIDAGSAISGCGPAYVDTFIEAMADAGVACGLPRAEALRLAAATVSGSAALVEESGMHPAQLRDAVCSPGGSTIAGVIQLENSGFRAAVCSCIEAAYERTKELGK